MPDLRSGVRTPSPVPYPGSGPFLATETYPYPGTGQWGAGQVKAGYMLDPGPGLCYGAAETLEGRDEARVCPFSEEGR